MNGGRIALGSVALACALSAAGCQGAYFLFPKEPKKKVTAEFDKLPGKNIALIVWADQATLDTDFAARYRTAEAVRYFLSRSVKGSKFVDLRDITDFQERSGTDWESLSNAELGRRFKADYVMRIDLLEYTPRARDAREVRKGQVRGGVSLFDVSQPGPDRSIYTTEVMASWPPTSNYDVLNYSDIDILNATLRVFGERLAQKFIEHEEAY